MITNHYAEQRCSKKATQKRELKAQVKCFDFVFLFTSYSL